MLISINLFSSKINIKDFSDILEVLDIYELPNGAYFSINSAKFINLPEMVKYIENLKEKEIACKRSKLKELGLIVEPYKIIKISDINTIFLAYLLDRLNLTMIDGKIFHNYDAEYIKRLITLENKDEYQAYQTELLTQKDTIINELSEINKKYLGDFFRLITLSKMMNAISTNGYEETIPEFKAWLESSRNGVFAGYYEQYAQEYISLIDDVLDNENDPKYIDKILKMLNNNFLELNYRISSNANYNELEIAYVKLEDIKMILLKNEDYPKVLEQTISDLSTLRELSLLDFEYLVTRNKYLFYENEETNMYYLYNIYEEIPYKNIDLGALISDNIIVSKYHSSEDIKALKDYSVYSYYLSGLLIESHHVKYEAMKSLIENIGFMENQGVNFGKWIQAANANEMEGSNIWEVLGIDKNASLDKNAQKTINIIEIFKNYSKFTKVVKAELGLSVEILDDGYDLTSMFFDPMSAVLLAKSMADKGYHIGLDEDGNQVVLDSNDIKIDLMIEIDSLIADIQNQQNSFLGNFGGLFDNSNLGDFLNGMNTQNSADFSAIMDFLDYSFTRDPKTGERLFSFDIGMSEIQDRILWNRISGSVGNYGYGWIVFGKDILWTTIGYAGGKLLDRVYDSFSNSRVVETKTLYGHDLLGLYRDIGRFRVEQGWDDKTISAYYNDALSNAIDERKLAQKELDKLLNKEKELNNKLELAKNKALSLEDNFSMKKRLLNSAINIYNNDPTTENGNKVTALSNDYLKAKRLLEESRRVVKILQNKLKILKKPIDKKSNNYQQKERKVIYEKEKKKKANEILDGNPQPLKSCHSDTYNTECDSGVGPIGDPRLILIKKGGLGRKLLEITNKRIANIPTGECNSNSVFDILSL